MRAGTPALDTPIDQVKGIRAKEAQLFKKLGINVFGDLLRHYPSRYQAYPPPAFAADLLMQPIASFVGIVQQVDIAPSPRGGLHKIVATLADRTGRRQRHLVSARSVQPGSDRDSRSRSAAS